MTPLGGVLLALMVATQPPLAEPAVRAVSVRGLRVGGTTTLTVDGDDLHAPRLLLPFPATQTLNPKSTDKQAVFDVALGADVTPGLYQLRVATRGGVSLPVVVGVDALPQLPFAPKIESLPVALHGTVGGAAVLEATFAGKAGQPVRVEVEARRLGSSLRPTIHLYGPNKKQIIWAWGHPRMHGDAAFTAVLPDDGTYSATLHDMEYAAPAPGFFRLKIGEWRAVSGVHPQVIPPKITQIWVSGEASALVERPAGGGPFVPLPWPAGGPWSGPRPFVEISSRPEFVAAGFPHPAPCAPPFGLYGRTQERTREHTFRVPVTPNAKVRFEILAERMGSHADVRLVVRNTAGAEVATADGGPGTVDPVIEYAVPDKVTAVDVVVIDRRNGEGPPAWYRLVADPVPATDDWRLTTPVQRMSLPVGGGGVIPVYVDRRGYAGPIDLSAKGLPGAVIPADADGVLITVPRGGLSDATVTEYRGRAGGTERLVMVKGHPLERVQPWLAAEVAVAPSAATAGEFAIDWRGLPDTATLVPGLKLALPLKVTRRDPTAPVRVTLLTSQAPPVLNNQPNPNAALRAEKPVELAAKVADGELVVLLPPELPASAYDVALQAEWLSADKQRVLTTAYTPVRKIPVRLPVVVKLPAAWVEVKADPKAPAAVEIKGEVVRAEGITGDVVVTLTGLPAGLTAAPVTVKPTDTAFVVKVMLPANSPAGEFKDVKLAATIAPDPKQPAARVKSRDVPVTVVVLPAGKP